MCNDLCNLTLVEAVKNLKEKKNSSVELTQAFILESEKQRHLNVFITETFDHALMQAKKSDEKIKAGNAGKLEGAPLGIKDLYCTKGIRTTAGSKILENFIPQYESTVSQNLLNEGAVFLGKTNMDEFAMGSSNITSYYGNVISPIRSKKFPEKDLVPGGSSGGSAAAVAAHMVLSSTASDTGGSIRQPASFTGTVGIKPTYGLCSRYGMIALASSLDQAGPIARDVRDAALMLSVMASFDKNDSTSLPGERLDYLANLKPSAKGIKIGLPFECFENLSEDLNRVLKENIEILKGLGAEFIEISLKNLKYALPAYYIIQPAEASSNLARYDGVRFGFRVENPKNLSDMYKETRRIGFGKEVRRRIFIGTFVLSKGGYDSYYILAKKVQVKIKEDFDEAFKKVDLILAPTTTGGAFGTEEGNKMSNVDMYLNDIFTVSVNIAGFPGISIPGGQTGDGLPLGIQFIGPKLSEQRLFNVSAIVEDAHKL
ncbi:MAG: Asp-tRNA(Asn)/Glu-tRNA(Gln) amidotransferase subunit GatA [Holosporales bacterium]|nr:Asp-tRNA(Asn)/Glu-tRNA(Gln) amidotransferase subunit GatA [Holosporales bacterium]